MARSNILGTAVNSSDLDTQKQDNYQSFTTTLIIAYYNMGIEFEYIKQFNLAVQSFSKGYQISLKELGNDHQLTQNLYKNMISLFNKNQVIKIF